jgi:hypothetical protein
MFPRQRRSVPTLALAALALLWLAGCDDDGARVSVDADMPVSYVALSPVAPPAPEAEEEPVNEHPRLEIWRAGYWSYDNGQFEWVAGEMLARPSPTAVWSPALWEHRSYGWAFVSGYWQ